MERQHRYESFIKNTVPNIIDYPLHVRERASKISEPHPKGPGYCYICYKSLYKYERKICRICEFYGLGFNSYTITSYCDECGQYAKVNFCVDSSNSYCNKCWDKP